MQLYGGRNHSTVDLYSIVEFLDHSEVMNHDPVDTFNRLLENRQTKFRYHGEEYDLQKDLIPINELKVYTVIQQDTAKLIGIYASIEEAQAVSEENPGSAISSGVLDLTIKD